jgi:hypothetical protein
MDSLRDAKHNGFVVVDEIRANRWLEIGGLSISKIGLYGQVDFRVADHPLGTGRGRRFGLRVNLTARNPASGVIGSSQGDISS